MATRLCPYCGEKIKAVAIKCKHCGSALVESDSRASGDPSTHIRLAAAPRFEIIEEIGRGGMAVVYKATQKNLGRVVALKVLAQHLTHDREFLERFHREARESAKLSHPHIVSIYDEGELDGLHYIAMELLEGRPLSEIIRLQGRLSIDETVRIVAPIADALAYAHRQGVIHRDVKSSNIFVTESGRAVLTDFGIARIADDSEMTRTGDVLGTPEYMSPEQARGVRVNNRCDQYALGVVLFECLTGSVPLRGETPPATIHKVIYERPPRLRTVINVPGWLDDLVDRLLEKEPSIRYESCEIISQALLARKHPKTIPVSQRKKKVERSPARGPRKHKVQWPLSAEFTLGLVIAIMIGILGFLLVLRFPVPFLESKKETAIPAPTSTTVAPPTPAVRESRPAEQNINQSIQGQIPPRDVPPPKSGPTRGSQATHLPPATGDSRDEKSDPAKGGTPKPPPPPPVITELEATRATLHFESNLGGGWYLFLIPGIDSKNREVDVETNRAGLTLGGKSIDESDLGLSSVVYLFRTAIQKNQSLPATISVAAPGKYLAILARLGEPLTGDISDEQKVDRSERWRVKRIEIDFREKTLGKEFDSFDIRGDEIIGRFRF